MNESVRTQPATPLLQWLVAEFARALDVDPASIDVDTEFDEYGLDSVQAVAISGTLSEHVGEELPATLLYEHPTIRRLAAHLARRGADRP
jgi:acyl carrier protein